MALEPHPDSSSFTQDKMQDVVVLVDYKYLGKYNTFAGTHTDIQSFTQWFSNSRVKYTKINAVYENQKRLSKSQENITEERTKKWKQGNENIKW